MRIIVPVVLLLLSAQVARGQTAAATAEPTLAASVQAPSGTLPPSQPVTTPTTSVLMQAAAESLSTVRAQVPTIDSVAEAQEAPRKRSRVVWFLLGAVAVLAIIVAAR